jgi:hypothetical protein
VHSEFPNALHILLQKYSPFLHKVLKKGNMLNIPKLGGRRVGKPCNWLIVWNWNLIIVIRQRITEEKIRKTDKVLYIVIVK